MRYGAARQLSRCMPGSFPWGTFLVNVAGAFLLGLMTGLGLPRAVLGVGFLGALTTFSTWQNEVVQALVRGDRRTAWLHLILSAAGGLLAAWAGLMIGRLAGGNQ